MLYKSLQNCLQIKKIDRRCFAATFAFDRDHGAATSNPNKGTANSTGVSNLNWKNSDVESDTYSTVPITGGNNSYELWTFGHFSGSFNQILSGLWAHITTNADTGITLKGIPAMPNTYIFTITSGNATVGATYTNNTQTFTVLETISAQAILVTSGTGAPAASGTLTKATGTGDATITFSAYGQSGLHYTTPGTTTNAALTTDMSTAIAIGSGVAVWFGPTGPASSGKAAAMATNPCYTGYLTTQMQTTSGAAAGDTSTYTFELQYQEN